MIRVLLIDDEPLARKRLRDLLQPASDVVILGEAENGLSAVQQIEKLHPDLIFLDIQMPDIDGFAVMRMIESETMPLVVFVTAFDQYAVDAFEVNAIDYVLKPVRHQRLEQTLHKARIKLTTTDHSLAHQQQFLQAYQPPVIEYMQRLPVRRQNRILIVPTTSVTSLALDQGLVMVTTLENTRYSTKFTTFSQVEPHLDPVQFLRVHRLFIVNLAHVREVITYDNNTASLVMACGNQVPVSRGHMKELRTALNL